LGCCFGERRKEDETAELREEEEQKRNAIGEEVEKEIMGQNCNALYF
jgi:hypothetical protein